MNRLLIFGFGYCGRAVAEAVPEFAVTATTRAPYQTRRFASRDDSGPGDSTVALVAFDAAEPAIAEASHILVTIPPGTDGDPVLRRYADVISAAPDVR